MHARSAIRFAVGSILLVGATVSFSTCSNVPAGGGGLEVTVVLESGVKSKCVLVKSASGSESRSSMPMVVGSKTELHVAVLADGLKPPTTVQAFGFSDDACTTAVPGEQSEAAGANFTVPVSHVTLTLKPAGQTDGGTNPDGGTDGGADGGVDQDMDGFPVGVDCDDTNPAIHPGVAENCSNGVDDNCDNARDCMDTATCNGMACLGGGLCMAGNCLQQNETICDDGLDNDGDQLIDCADPTCVSQVCSDGNGCTTGDRCVADAGCVKTGDVSCMSPPSGCFNMAGTCNPDGGTCSYVPNTNACNDTLGCTTNDVCNAGVCSGMPRTCNTPPTSCFAPTGSCIEPNGTCSYAPIAAGQGTCTDNDNCTTGDTCAGDGGCAGTPVTCTPGQCQMNNGCSAGGTCMFSATTGAPCDAGTGGPAACDSSANCNPAATLFPFTPSNFNEAQLPTDAGVNLTVSCPATIATNGTPGITSGCGLLLPPYTIITQSNGREAVLFRLASLTVNSSQTLTLTGNRPAIFAVTGNATINRNGVNVGRIVANNYDAPPGCGVGGNAVNNSGHSGGGGGGYGLDGGTGGDSGGASNNGGTGGVLNGVPAIIPLRGGCAGGDGTSASGPGGGGLQLTVGGTLTLSGIINAPGQGGTGASGNKGNSGGGGGSGGSILLEANLLSLSNGGLFANGGSGGEGSGGSTGSNGLDGAETTTPTPAGGDFSGNGGNGGVGGASGGGATAGAPGTGSGDGGGGGGGAIGRIRLNSVMNCARSNLTSSPAATGNAGCP